MNYNNIEQLVNSATSFSNNDFISFDEHRQLVIDKLDAVDTEKVNEMYTDLKQKIIIDVRNAVEDPFYNIDDYKYPEYIKSVVINKLAIELKAKGYLPGKDNEYFYLYPENFIERE